MNLNQSDVIGLANFLINQEILMVSYKILESNLDRAKAAQTAFQRHEQLLTEIASSLKEKNDERIV